MIKTIHSYWAYLVLIVLILAVFKALLGYFGKKDYDAKAFRVSLFTLIVSHIQLLVTDGESCNPSWTIVKI